MKMFRILSKGYIYDDSHEYVEEKNLELVNCKCHGKIKIVETRTNGYDKRISHILECQSCHGIYGANEVMKEEWQEVIDNCKKPTKE